MHLPFKAGAQRVLQWNADSSEFADALSLLSELPVDQAPTRSAFLLQLVERKHAVAVVLTSNPFAAELSLMRQFIHQLESAPPVVLVLIDCPFAVVGLEKEFFAVVQIQESFADLSPVLQAAIEHGMAGQRGANAETLWREEGGENSIVVKPTYQELTRASQMPIVNISGETGTGKSLLARTLHQIRGGIKQDCFTFYCGEHENSVTASVEHLLRHSPTPNTFVLCDPRIDEAQNIAEMFTAPAATDWAATNQLIVLSQFAHRLQAAYQLDLVPLRERAEQIPEFAAGTLAGFANRFAGSRIEIDPAGIALLQKYNWPGNICQFNLMLAKSLLDQANRSEQEIRISSQALQSALSPDTKNDWSSRMHIRNQLNEACAAYAKCGWGDGQELRELLNRILQYNVQLAWQVRACGRRLSNHERRAA